MRTNRDMKAALILLIVFAVAFIVLGVSTGWNMDSPTQAQDHEQAIKESLR